MVLRDLVGGAARLSAGVWKEVANVVDPQPAVEVADEPTAPPEPELGGEAKQGVPDGAMLVPIDSWTRVLDQLGNLHQAGQDLAEARERAARAETESAFLREQLADLKARQRRSPPKPKPKPKAVPDTPPVATAPAGSSRAAVTRANVLRARERASDWLRPR